jgi:O-antigen/teichoic acid export membrane protein
MRTKKTIINTMVGLISALITTILSFFLNRVFLSTLGLDYLGLNGIFSNALGMLSLTELGIGLAISYELYEPLARNDSRKVSALMNLYKKAYYIIAIITFIVGLFVGIFICTTAKTTEISFSERLIYFTLFLANNCCTYLLSYKRTLLEADQKGYIISAITSFATIIATIAKIAVLYCFSSYVLYIVISIVQTLSINVIASVYIDKLYPYIKDSTEKLDNGSYKNLLTEVKSRIVIKLCNVLVSSTDNIIIGSIISVASAGLFQNYSLIVSQLNVFISQIENAITPSLGNYAAVESEDNLGEIIKEIEFFNHCIGSFCFVCFCMLISPFIQVWLGDYHLPFAVPFLLMCDLYITLIRDVHWKVNNMTVGFKENNRIWFHIFRAAINLVVSFVGAKFMGISGVVLGTVISSLVIWIAEVVYTYRIVINNSLIHYFLRQGLYVVQLLIIYAIVYEINTLFYTDNVLTTLIIKGILIPIMTIIFLVGFNIKNPYVRSFYNRVEVIIKK